MCRVTGRGSPTPTFSSIRRRVSLFRMAVVFVTGMSEVGKSAALAELARRGYRTVDTDYGGFADQMGPEQLCREDRIQALLDEHKEGVLFVSGCVANPAKVLPAVRC